MESIGAGPVKTFPFNAFQEIHLLLRVETSILHVTAFH